MLRLAVLILILNIYIADFFKNLKEMDLNEDINENETAISERVSFID